MGGVPRPRAATGRAERAGPDGISMRPSRRSFQLIAWDAIALVAVARILAACVSALLIVLRALSRCSAGREAQGALDESMRRKQDQEVELLPTASGAMILGTLGAVEMGLGGALHPARPRRCRRRRAMARQPGAAG